MGIRKVEEEQLKAAGRGLPLRGGGSAGGATVVESATAAG